MTIRRALPDEAATLTQIALDAKRYWGYPEHWINHWESDLTISPEFIRDNLVYVAEEDGEIRGFYALSVRGDKAELEHMWVAPQWFGTGVGKELLLDLATKKHKKVPLCGEY
ncbi:MAG TPA: GNAT family N-acetyltransferase [Pyrinomonadaceae bacterium]|nr:GNAT family N-acetyltransferase [Pyrinomonadaceae bacterium]